MPTRTDVCIIGGGPAGCVLGARLAQFGFNVCLVERMKFPRRHLGESLSPGVVPLLASIGAGPAIEKADSPRVRRVSVHWEERREREDPHGHGMLVDRGHFDQLLLDHARDCGVRVLQPATAEELRRSACGWTVTVSGPDRKTELEARFVADASGRSGVRRRCRCATGPRTLALHAYWEGAGLPTYPRIEAGAKEWYWGVPLPDGVYNTLVFLDPRDLRVMAGTLEEKFHRLIATSSLLPPGVQASLVGDVHATDATPYLDHECVTEDSIKVGDAALALDPLSSSGVQKAIQCSLAGAAVVNTLLQRPQDQALAQQFYRESLSGASTRHCAWARAHYARAAASRPARFWRARAEGKPSGRILHTLLSAGLRPDARQPVAPSRVGDRRSGLLVSRAGHEISVLRDIAGAGAPATMPPDAPLRLAAGVKIIDRPCLVDRFVETRAAVCFPSLSGPVAYLGGLELAPLLRGVQSGMTPSQLTRSWRRWVPPRTGLAIAQWLFSRGLLVPSVAGERGSA
jgi:2-polyprenyl-6-methoxyphenol hydroxylase-like FAD-dependent oxidoreductase